MAKKFHFRLQTVLNIREKQVTEAKNELYEVLRLKFQKEAEITELIKEKNLQFEAKRKTTLKAMEMQSVKDHINMLNYKITKAKNELLKIEEIEKIKRNNLNEALQKEKILLNLKEKKIEEYKKELNIEETNFLNEISSQMYQRNKNH